MLANPDGTKFCPCCSTLKTINNFCKKSTTSDLLSLYCRDCCKQKRTTQQKIAAIVVGDGFKICPKCEQNLSIENFRRDSSKSRGMASYCKNCHNDWKFIRRRTPEKILDIKFREIKYSAKEREYSFSISKQEYLIIAVQSCAYCGLDSKGGLDRIDSKLGYELSNINPCCATCNRMKMDHTLEYFINHIKLLASRF